MAPLRDRGRKSERNAYRGIPIHIPVTWLRRLQVHLLEAHVSCAPSAVVSVRRRKPEAKTDSGKLQVKAQLFPFLISLVIKLKVGELGGGRGRRREGFMDQVCGGSHWLYISIKEKGSLLG